MSLETLRALRKRRLRPVSVSLVTRDCPHPEWPWLADDPALVWIGRGADIRAADLRPLHGVAVQVLTDDFDSRWPQVEDAMESVGAVLVGMSDGTHTLATDKHPWAARLIELAEDEWQSLIEPVIAADWRLFFDGGIDGIAH